MAIAELSCRVVLFDCDGVLVDSDATVTRSWHRWAQAYALEPDAVVSRTHGRRASDSVALLVGETDRAVALERINAYELDDAASVLAIPGALDLISSVPDPARAVVTSGSTALAKARLRAAGIDPPSVLVTGDDIANGKPAPDGYLQAAAALGVAPRDAVVLEDSRTGVEAAHAAGVGGVIGVGPSARDTGADVVVADLRVVTWTGSGLRVADTAAR